MSMQDVRKAFITLAIEHEALRFGEFTLKSGRISPYFFNAGCLYTGAALAALGKYYALALLDHGVGFDMLFGPAYKGIPLATTLSVALSEYHQQDIPVCYNRKETKDHGEGGLLVGAPLAGRVAIVDDVITAGTAIREVVHIVQAADARPAAVVIGLDRQERGRGDRSAIQEVEQDCGIPVISIIRLDDIIDYIREQLLSDQPDPAIAPVSGNLPELLDTMLEYRSVYEI